MILIPIVFKLVLFCLVLCGVQEKELAPPEEKFNRPALEDLVKRRFFYSVSFGIYGGEEGGRELKEGEREGGSGRREEGGREGVEGGRREGGREWKEGGGKGKKEEGEMEGTYIGVWRRSIAYRRCWWKEGGEKVGLPKCIVVACTYSNCQYCPCKCTCFVARLCWFV